MLNFLDLIKDPTRCLLIVKHPKLTCIRASEKISMTLFQEQNYMCEQVKITNVNIDCMQNMFSRMK